MLLGFWATSALGPGADLVREPHVAASSHVLSDPSGFGEAVGQDDSAPGVLSDDGTEAEVQATSSAYAATKPTVKGALSELHQAVSEMIQSWNPYQPEPAEPPSADRPINKTAPAKGRPAVAIGGETIKEEDHLGARTRIGKCTILFNSNAAWERAIRTHEQHDRLHGYRLHVLRQNLMDDVWSKPAYILSLLLRELSKPESERLEWLFWVDADTIILNPYVPIETFLPPPGSEFDDIHLMYTNDWNGLNNGVFPLRVNRWSVELFSAIISYRYYRADAPLVFRDQSAMDALLKEPKFANHIVETPQRWFNAYQGEHNETLAPFQIRRGDLLVHFAGVAPREPRMVYWLERAEQHLDDWEIPLKSTSYPQEAREFWSVQSARRKDRQKFLTDLRIKAARLMAQTESKLRTFGQRLTEEENARIVDARVKLQKVVDDEHWQEKADEVEELINKLNDAAGPLIAAADTSHKALLHSAHEAIFAGEKDLLEAGYSEGHKTPELEQIEEKIKSLKTLIMTPQEFWNTPDLQNAVDAVVQAKAGWQERLAAEQQREQAVAEARKQVLAEAGQVDVVRQGTGQDVTESAAEAKTFAGGADRVDPVAVSWSALDTAAATSTGDILPGDGGRVSGP